MYDESTNIYISLFTDIKVRNMWNTLKRCSYMLNTGWRLAQTKEAIPSQSKKVKFESKSEQKPKSNKNQSDDTKHNYDKTKSSDKSNLGTLNSKRS